MSKNSTKNQFIVKKIKTLCKVNLCLYVDPHKICGLHRIFSVFLKVHNLYDNVNIYFNKYNQEFTKGTYSFAKKKPIINFIINKRKKNIENNSVELLFKKLLALLSDKYNIANSPVNCISKIEIDKRIPIGAGLGGGSGNAGCVARFLYDRFLKNIIKEDDITHICKEIGSDVLFFFYKYDLAAVSSFGEVINPVEIENLEKYLMLIVYPCINISTKNVYNNFDKEYEKLSNNSKDFHLYCKNDCEFFKEDLIITNELLKSLVFHGTNQLYQSAIKENAVISDVINELKSSEGCINTVMTGSGSACVAFFGKKTEAKKCIHNIKKYRNWRLYLTTTILK